MPHACLLYSEVDSIAAMQHTSSISTYMHAVKYYSCKKHIWVQHTLWWY